VQMAPDRAEAERLLRDHVARELRPALLVSAGARA